MHSTIKFSPLNETDMINLTKFPSLDDHFECIFGRNVNLEKLTKKNRVSFFSFIPKTRTCSIFRWSYLISRIKYVPVESRVFGSAAPINPVGNPCSAIPSQYKPHPIDRYTKIYVNDGLRISTRMFRHPQIARSKPSMTFYRSHTLDVRPSRCTAHQTVTNVQPLRTWLSSTRPSSRTSLTGRGGICDALNMPPRWIYRTVRNSLDCLITIRSFQQKKIVGSYVVLFSNYSMSTLRMTSLLFSKQQEESSSIQSTFI